MKNTKKALIRIITVALALLTVAACVFTAAGDDTYIPTFNANALNAYNSQGYGSFDQGVVAPFKFYRFYHPSVQYGNPTIDGHPNLDFQKGYEFWHNGSTFEMNTDSTGNTYATVIGENENSGISTIKFTHSKLKAGDTIGMLFKWRNKAHQRAVEASIDELYEIDSEATAWKTVRVVGNDGRGVQGIWTVDEEDDTAWNIALARTYNPVKEPTGKIPIVYYSASIQTTVVSDIFKGTDMDDLQIVRVDESTGLVSDLDGKTLYNLNNLPKLESPDYVFGEDLGETDPKADIKVNVQDLISGKIDLDESVADSKDETQKSSTGLALWVWIVIAVGVVLLLAAAAVVVIIVVKKKKAAATVPTEEAEAPAEEITTEETATEETPTEE